MRTGYDQVQIGVGSAGRGTPGECLIAYRCKLAMSIAQGGLGLCNGRVVFETGFKYKPADQFQT